MGLMSVELEVANTADLNTTEKLEFLVDSGAVYSVVPAPVLERLRIAPFTEETFRLANGDKIVRKRGFAVFKYEERIGGGDVIFGEEGDAILLGALTLESLGLAFHPLKREFKPMPMILFGQA